MTHPWSCTPLSAPLVAHWSWSACAATSRSDAANSRLPPHCVCWCDGSGSALPQWRTCMKARCCTRGSAQGPFLCPWTVLWHSFFLYFFFQTCSVSSMHFFFQCCRASCQAGGLCRGSARGRATGSQRLCHLLFFLLLKCTRLTLALVLDVRDSGKAASCFSRPPEMLLPMEGAADIPTQLKADVFSLGVTMLVLLGGYSHPLLRLHSRAACCVSFLGWGWPVVVVVDVDACPPLFLFPVPEDAHKLDCNERKAQEEEAMWTFCEQTVHAFPGWHCFLNVPYHSLLPSVSRDCPCKKSSPLAALAAHPGG